MKQSKNQFRRAKKKAQKVEALDGATAESKKAAPQENAQETAPIKPVTSTIDTLPEAPELDNPLWNMYKGIINKFDDPTGESTQAHARPEVFFNDDDDIPDEEQENEAKISKKKRKELNKLSVAELKRLARKPELVEWTDTSAMDPNLLIQIKAQCNIVPVPSHWSLKREYLSSKRGIEKAQFALPKFIQETGIAEMRDAALEKQEQSSLKQKQRERVQPKMGRLDIDYQKLYEAFFRFQEKPELTRYGETYYEGKEYETNLRHLRPGELSDELRDALGMAPGAAPPWLFNQQTHGPPPSYPALRIPGVNAPPPPGGAWGFHPGGYGKPPTNDHNQPKYGGDIFGVLQPQQRLQQGEPIEKDLWGELQPSEESEEESEEEEERESEEEAESDGEHGDNEQRWPSAPETSGRMASAEPPELLGAESVSGEFDARKHRANKTEETVHPRQAYQVIPERQTRIQGRFGSDRAYDLSGDQGRKRKKPGDVDVSVDVDAISAGEGMSKENLQKLYDTQRQQESNPQWGFQEDLSDMIAQESRKRIRKDEEKRGKQ
ncbi:hypothetical protein N7468_003302 [Penicillium chermesinum]|uniref:PSP proline-rich domain-containing protein n=1 Tax=Penicillium chermesinum TaxID=63820 RepID=A0A9W9P667_9EURO|nr:uncharacterized protein N7468_003302 [Penicillium chermesinum]KAJ5238683.1 hypothetical protein N7468_003302 [Penicillium chermesinum]